VTQRWLILDLCAPLMAFGGVTIDHVGPTRDFPAASMLTGLFGNALGWHWSDGPAHQALQDRLIFAARVERGGRLVTDSQNAKLEKADKGWTTHGTPEGRFGASYDAPHRRRRDYLADARVLVVLRLSTDDLPTLDMLAEALTRPARPLFIGRKPCLPTRPLHSGWCEAVDAHSALTLVGTTAHAVAQWPVAEGPEGDRRIDLPDLRNWRSGLHGGSRAVAEGRMPARGGKAGATP
jgi:CRISPR system Cascade subunit CasD